MEITPEIPMAMDQAMVKLRDYSNTQYSTLETYSQLSRFEKLFKKSVDNVKFKQQYLIVKLEPSKH